MSPGRKRPLNAAFWACLAMAGCTETRSSAGEPSRTDADALEARSRALERKAVARVPPPEQPAAVVRGIPAEVMQRIRHHLAERTGAAPEAFDIVRAEAHEWPSGAMGCPQPGVNYTQAPVAGYWVVLRHAGRDYDYRMANSGYFVACEAINVEEPPVR